MLLKRKKAAPVVLKIWAVLRIVVGGFVVTNLQLLTGEITKLAMELARAQQGGDPNSEKIFDAFGSLTEVMIKIGMVIGFIWLAALPVFILIWMSREKNKREIATW